MCTFGLSDEMTCALLRIFILIWLDTTLCGATIRVLLMSSVFVCCDVGVANPLYSSVLVLNIVDNCSSAAIVL